ncbi:MAG: porin family protein [Bacteroidota bacterium]
MLQSTLNAMVIVLCAAAAVPAQVTIGVKAGPNAADVVMTGVIDKDAEADLNVKLSYHGGVYINLALTEQLFLQGEVLYSNKGVNAITNINLHYINIPILLQYTLTKKLFVEVGPELGYLFSARSRYGDVSNVWNNKLDIGLDAGLLLTAFPKVAVGLRFNGGFSSVQENAQAMGSNIKFQNRVLQLSLAYNLFTKQP